MDNRHLLGNYKTANYKRGGRSMNWGTVLDFKDDRAVVFSSQNPVGSRVYEVAIYELCNWIRDKVIWK